MAEDEKPEVGFSRTFGRGLPVKLGMLDQQAVSFGMWGSRPCMMFAKEECVCPFRLMTDFLGWVDKSNAEVITGSGVLKGRTATSSFRSEM